MLLKILLIHWLLTSPILQGEGKGCSLSIWPGLTRDQRCNSTPQCHENPTKTCLCPTKHSVRNHHGFVPRDAAQDCKKLQNCELSSVHLPLPTLPPINSICTSCHRKAINLTKERSHPSHSLFSSFLSGRRYKGLQARVTWLNCSLPPPLTVIRPLNRSRIN